MGTDWAWVADPYRDVPRPNPEALARAIDEAVRVRPRRAVAARAWWLGAGAAAAVGWLVFGRSGVAPFRAAPVERLAGLPSNAVPTSPEASATEEPRSAAPAEAPVAILPQRGVTTPAQAPEIAAQSRQAMSARDTVLAPKTPDPVVSVPIEIAGVSKADLERLQRGLGDAGLRGFATLLRRAENDGLPSAPLLDRAMVGLAHGASATVILTAVEQRASALRLAQGALGAGASDGELIAGADALDAGAAARELAEVRRRFPRGRATAALLTLAGLVADGVPAAAAADALAQSKAGVSDAALLALRTGVTADVARGVPPLAALRARVEGLGEESSDPRFRRPELGQPVPGDIPRAP